MCTGTLALDFSTFPRLVFQLRDRTNVSLQGDAELLCQSRVIDINVMEERDG